jgi:hypothetical protein
MPPSRPTRTRPGLGALLRPTRLLPESLGLPAAVPVLRCRCMHLGRVVELPDVYERGAHARFADVVHWRRIWRVDRHGRQSGMSTLDHLVLCPRLGRAPQGRTNLFHDCHARGIVRGGHLDSDVVLSMGELGKCDFLLALGHWRVRIQCKVQSLDGVLCIDLPFHGGGGAPVIHDTR